MPGLIRLGLVVAFLGAVAPAVVQINVQQSNKSLDALMSQIQELRTALEAMRGELAGTRRESQELRKELEAMRRAMAEVRTAPVPAEGAVAAEDRQVTDAKLNDLYQTKVASGSRYRVRLSGMALFNAVSTRGAVDQIDLPLQAQPKNGNSDGSLAGTVRQSMVSLEVSGPDWKGAKTGGELTVDFFGGFPATPEGVTTGLLRLRTAKATIDWKSGQLGSLQNRPVADHHPGQ